jgi:hypothetical protein
LRSNKRGQEIIGMEEVVSQLKIGTYTFKLLKRPNGSYKSEPLPPSQEEKGIPIVPQGRKLIAIFDSQSNPSDKHYLYKEANGEIYCTCWGFRSPNKCWHYRGIKEAINNGEIDLDKLKEPIKLGGIN